MTTRNVKQTENVKPETAVVPLWKALEDPTMLNCKASSLFVATKRHAWLKAGIHTLVSAETGRPYKVIETAVMNRYIAERRQGGGSTGAHDGQVKHGLWLSEAEVERAAALLSAEFGRDVKIARLYKVKVKDGAAVNGASDVEDGEDGDGEDSDA